MDNSDLNNTYEFKAFPIREKYYNDESVWGCFVFKSYDEIPGATKSFEFNSNNQMVETYHSIIVGKMQHLNLNLEYNVKAKLIYSAKYKSYQFEVISINSPIPKSIDDQAIFLKSIVNENQANTLLKLYPNIVEDVINGVDNVNLNITTGIKEITWNKIKQKILENYVLSDLLILLTPLGVSYNKIKRLLNDEPNPNILKQMLLNDPYIIAEIDGISFRQADQVALKINPDFLISKTRTISFIKNYLFNLGNTDGHTWVAINSIKNAVIENITECSNLVNDIIENEKINRSFLFIENDKVGLKYYYEVESKIWEIINQLNQATPLEIGDNEIDIGIKIAEKKQGFEFTPEQKEILINSTKNNLIILTGMAGTGKTTIARGILEIYSLHNIAACALSAKAAKRIEEVTGFQASTIHRLLGAKGPNRFEYNEKNKLNYDVIFVDESSMIFSGLFYNLLSSIYSTNTKVIICGDNKQLPPIGYGNTFTDLLSKQNLTIFYLKKILRQAGESGIILDSNKIRYGTNPISNKTRIETHGVLQDMHYMFRSDKIELNQLAIKMYMKTIQDPEIGVDNCFIITPRKNGSINSTKELNRTIQNLLLDESLPYVKYGEGIFRQGARVIHVINNYEKGVFNGDMGYIDHIKDIREEGSGTIVVKFPDGREIDYLKEELNELNLAYALTVHKFQGSECNTIIIVLDNNGYMLLDRGMLYTAITRAKKRCLLLAEPYAYDKCIEVDKGNERNTWTKFFK